MIRRLFGAITRLNIVGTWRSLVAHLHGVQGVASSNLAVPTNHKCPTCSILPAE